MAVIYLDQLLPAGSPAPIVLGSRPISAGSDPPAVIARAKQQHTWSCRRWGLPCRGRHRPCGALLPHHFTVACAVFPAIGCVFSVALSRGFARVAVSHHRALSCSDFPPRTYFVILSHTLTGSLRATQAAILQIQLETLK